MAEIKHDLPKIVGASVSWVIDDNVIHDGLSSVIGKFIDEHVVPVVKDSFSSVRSIEWQSGPCRIETSGGALHG